MRWNNNYTIILHTNLEFELFYYEYKYVYIYKHKYIIDTATEYKSTLILVNIKICAFCLKKSK